MPLFPRRGRLGAILAGPFLLVIIMSKDDETVPSLEQGEKVAELLGIKNVEWAALASEVGMVVDKTNAAYGDSFAKSGAFLRLLYPEGIKPDQYQDMLALIRVFDKQMRIATNPDAFGESPFRDIAGYGLLGYREHLTAGKVRR